MILFDWALSKTALENERHAETFREFIFQGFTPTSALTEGNIKQQFEFQDFQSWRKKVNS